MQRDRVQFQLEFPIECSQTKLYEYISTAFGLSQWFANTVTEDDNGLFTWEWDDIKATALVEKKKRNRFIKFRVQENHPIEFFLMEIIVNEITKDIALVITDYADKNEVDDYKELWSFQVEQLQNLIAEEG